MKIKIDKVNRFKLPVQDGHKAKDLNRSLTSPQKGIEPKQLLQPSIPHKSTEDPKHNKLAGQPKLALPINQSSLVIQSGSVSDIIKKPMNPSAEQPASIINKLEIDKQVADAVSQLGVTNFNNLVKAILGTVEREVQTNTGVSDQAGSLSDFNPVLRGIESQFERLAASMNNETISSSSRSNLDVPLSDLLANPSIKNINGYS